MNERSMVSKRDSFRIPTASFPHDLNDILIGELFENLWKNTHNVSLAS